MNDQDLASLFYFVVAGFSFICLLGLVEWWGDKKKAHRRAKIKIIRKHMVTDRREVGQVIPMPLRRAR